MADIYDVIAVDQIEDLQPGGRFVSSRRIQFKTKPWGDVAEIILPVDQATSDVVDATIRAHAAQMNLIRGL